MIITINYDGFPLSLFEILISVFYCLVLISQVVFMYTTANDIDDSVQ